MAAIPASHIADAQLLEADAIIELFTLTPTVGGTIYFKPGADATWQGQTYTGLPVTLTGVKKSADSNTQQPRLSIGTPDIDMSLFKPLVFDGYVDGATLVYMRVLLAHLLSNTNIKETKTYRVKRIEAYSRSQIVLGLSTSSDAMQFTIPNLQYYPPDFPAVMT